MKKINMALALTLCSLYTMAANVLPTPGSSAGYLYFPATSSVEGAASSQKKCHVGMNSSEVSSGCSIGGDVTASSTDNTVIGLYTGQDAIVALTGNTGPAPTFAAAVSECNMKNPVGKWSLPTRARLDAMYANRLIIAGYSPSRYFSSEQYDSSSVYLLNFVDGVWDARPKTQNWQMRCVRSFQ